MAFKWVDKCSPLRFAITDKMRCLLYLRIGRSALESPKRLLRGARESFEAVLAILALSTTLFNGMTLPAVCTAQKAAAA